MKARRVRLSYANVVSTIALFLVLTGATAFAASQLGKNSVGAKQLKSGSVTAAKIKDGAVTAAKIKDGAIAGVKLGGGAVGSGQLGEGSVISGKIAADAVTDDKLATKFLAASTPGVPMAGANVSASGVLRSWFNRFGGSPSVQHSVTGVYVITFPGLAGQAYYDSSVSTATLIAGPGEIAIGSESANPRIATFNSAGAAANSDFNFILFLPGTE